MTEQMYSDAEFEALLNNYDYSFQKGDLVKGIVCSYDSSGVIVDIGADEETLEICRRFASAHGGFEIRQEDF